MAKLTLSLLGPMALAIDGVPVRAFEAARVQALLAYLTAEHEHPHSRESLGEMLWPERPRNAVLSNLRKALFRLRQAIGDQEASPPYLLTTQKTLQWNSASDQWVDVAAFESLIARTRTHQHETLERCDTCTGLLKQAVALYRGDFLEDVYLEDSADFEEWALVRREALRRQVLDALDSLLTHYEMQADYAQAEKPARRRIILDPLNEEAHRRLMLILARAGRRSEALAQFQSCHDILAAELGIEPSQETVTLYERIHAGALPAGDEPRWAPSLEALPSGPSHNLPLQLTAFVGREPELEDLARRLENPTQRLITIVGLGGMGKTRLALAAADRVKGYFPHGVWFVSLASVSPNGSAENSPDTLAAMIGHALSVEFSGKTEPTNQIINTLRHRSLLLVLDNFENLLGATGYLIEILQKAPLITILATSRERLNLQAEHVMRLDGLPVPEPGSNVARKTASIQLFAERAEYSSGAGWENNCELSHITEVCRLTQGIPLAIELAAAWTGHLNCADIAQAIRQDLEFLATSMHDVPERQRSLRAVFDHTWSLLAGAEASALAKLSVFRGGFTLDAAEYVAGASLKELASLEDRSLVQRDASGRYVMHELLRKFAHEKLAESGELATTAERHFAHYLHLFEEAAPRIRSSQRRPTLKRLAADFDNFRAALQWSGEEPGRLEDNLRLASAAGWWLWQYRGEFREGRSWLEKALDGAATETEADVRARAIYSAVALAFYQGEMEAARMLAQEAIVLRQTISDMAGLAEVRGALGLILAMQGEFDEAIPTLKESTDLASKANDRWLLSLLHSNTGDAFVFSSDDQAAYPYYTQALRIAREVGDPWLIMIPLHGLGMVLMRQHDYDAARALFEEALAIQREVGASLTLARTLWRLGDVALASGDHLQASTHYAESLEIWRRLGNGEHMILLQGNLATVAQFHGEYELAARLLHECVNLRWDLWSFEGMTRCLIGLAGMALFAGRPERAAYLLGAADRFSKQIDRNSSPADRLEYERVLQDVRPHLDQEDFAIAWDQGAAITEEQALENALSEATGAWGLFRTESSEQKQTS